MTPIFAGEWQNALFISSALFVIVVAIELFGRHYAVAHETTRKTAHVLCGIGLVLIPWDLTTVWGPLVFAGTFALFMAVTKKVGLLRSVHGVARETTGATLYPVGVLVAFFLLGGNHAGFKIAVLMLALGDAAAALCGRAMGKRRYVVFGENRTLEGSLACWLICALVMGIGLSWAWSLPPANVVVFTLASALLVAASEALSPRGSDNFFMPVTAAVMIQAVLTANFTTTALLLTAVTVGAAAVGRVSLGRKTVLHGIDTHNADLHGAAIHTTPMPSAKIRYSSRPAA